MNTNREVSEKNLKEKNSEVNVILKHTFNIKEKPITLFKTKCCETCVWMKEWSGWNFEHDSVLWEV